MSARMKEANKKAQKDDLSDIPMVCRSCDARHRGVCGALTITQLIELSGHTSKHIHKSGEELHAPEQETDSYSNILGGVVKLTKLLTDGRQQIVGLQFAPDFLGRPFKSESSVYAEAATEVRTCSFPKSVLDRLIAEQPELEHRLYEQALKELDEARDWMMTLGRKTAQEKLASFLVLVARHIDPESTNQKNISFELPLKRADIADFLGLTIETVSRQITNLRKSGYITFEDAKEVTVLDLTRLEKLAQDDR